MLHISPLQSLLEPSHTAARNFPPQAKLNWRLAVCDWWPPAPPLQVHHCVGSLVSLATIDVVSIFVHWFRSHAPRNRRHLPTFTVRGVMLHRCFIGVLSTAMNTVLPDELERPWLSVRRFGDDSACDLRHELKETQAKAVMITTMTKFYTGCPNIRGRRCISTSQLAVRLFLGSTYSVL